MSKCKNIECNNETENNKIYCSLKCRNIYVNKYVRNYDKVKENFQIKRNDAEIEYLKNPKFCMQCGEIISYQKSLINLNFCNHSCSTKFGNKNRKGIKYNLSSNGKKILQESAFKNLNTKYIKEKEIYYEEPKYCLNCNSILEFKHRNRIFCNVDCKKEYYSKNKEDFDLYYSLSKFKFNLKDFNEEFDFNLIEKYGWYKAKNNGDNIDGVSRDHMYSIKEGFRKLVNPLLLAHPANCELIINKYNQSKSDNCSLTLEELLKKIEIFENKYGKFYKNNIKIYINSDELKEIYKGCVV